MLKRILLASLVPVMLSATGCMVEPVRPRYVQPQYVAQCPAGYRYDGNTCVRIPHRNANYGGGYYYR